MHRIDLDELRSAFNQTLPDGLADAPRAELQTLLGKFHRLTLAVGLEPGSPPPQPTDAVDVLVFVCSPNVAPPSCHRSCRWR